MKILLILLLAVQGVLLSALDFGLILSQQAVFADPEYVEYSPIAIPWFAAPLGKQADLYISGGVGAGYTDGEWKHLFEVYRSELTVTPSAGLSFSIGRQTFQDSPGLILSGLFDGVSATWDIGGGQLNLGVFYTGLLYKETALVVIGQRDHDYFAPQHVAGGINWEKTSIFDSSLSMWLSGIFQVDLNDTNEKVHSQYLAAKFAAPFGSAMHFDFSGAFALLQKRDIHTAFAMSANVYRLFYGTVPGIVSLGGQYSSGAADGTLDAFAPITGEAQSMVLRPILSGIALAQAAYTARFRENFFTELSAAYLFSTDADSGSPLMGGEFCLSLAWAPFSDLVVTLGGGLFLPQMGNAFGDDATTRYRIELTADISF